MGISDSNATELEELVLERLRISGRLEKIKVELREAVRDVLTDTRARKPSSEHEPVLACNVDQDRIDENKRLMLSVIWDYVQHTRSENLLLNLLKSPEKAKDECLSRETLRATFELHEIEDEDDGLGISRCTPILTTLMARYRREVETQGAERRGHCVDHSNTIERKNGREKSATQSMLGTNYTSSMFGGKTKHKNGAISDASSSQAQEHEDDATTGDAISISEESLSEVIGTNSSDFATSSSKFSPSVTKESIDGAPVPSGGTLEQTATETETQLEAKTRVKPHKALKQGSESIPIEEVDEDEDMFEEYSYEEESFDVQVAGEAVLERMFERIIDIASR